MHNMYKQYFRRDDFGYTTGFPIHLLGGTYFRLWGSCGRVLLGVLLRNKCNVHLFVLHCRIKESCIVVPV